jgi:hypothetical protein
MSFSITITLTTAGADTGPFDIYENSSGPFNLLVSGISKASLVSGYPTTVPNGTTQVRVISTGACANSIDIPVTGLPVTTTTTTTTTTTSTSTTSTTTTSPPTLYIATLQSSSCSYTGGTTLPTYLYTGTQTLCACTSISGANITGLANGNYYISDGTNVRLFTKTGGIGSATMDASGSCTSC